MPIMAVQDQNDVRGSTRVLANTAKRYIDQPPADKRHVPAMNGVFRLLKAYRTSKLRGYEYHSSVDRGPDAVYMLPPPTRHVAELREALHDALSETAGKADSDTVIDTIQAVLRQSVGNGSPVDAEGRRTTLAFLQALLTHLSPVR